MKLLLLLASLAGAQAPEQVFPLPLFKDGLYTRYSANAIPDGGLATALNVTLDEDVDGVVVARGGYAKYNTTAISTLKTVRGLWTLDATDGTKYLVAFSSSSFYKSTGDGTWTGISGADGFSTTKEFSCTQTIGRLWCANGDTVFSWNGTSTAPISGAPVGNLVGRFRNRVLISGIAGSKGRVRGSGELDGTDFAVQVPGVSTTPFNIAFGGSDDGEEITCLMGAYQDVFLVGKRNSLWGLYGFGRNDFQVRELSREVGCLEQRSVQEKNNCLYWLSLRGVERFCGTSIDRISDPIRDQLDTIVATAGNPRSVVDTSQADFEAGNLTASGAGAPISATITPASITPTTWTAVDTTTANFTAGVGGSTSTALGDGELRPGVLFLNAGFETGTLVGGLGAGNWTQNSQHGSNPDTDCGSGGGTFTQGGARVANNTSSCSGSAATNWFVELLRASDDAVLYRQTGSNISGQACTAYSFDASTQTVLMKIRFRDDITPTAGETVSIPTFSTHSLVGGIYRFGVAVENSGSGCSGGTLYTTKFDSYDPYFVPTSTFTSQSFDTALSTPVWGVFVQTVTANETTLRNYTQSSADNVTFDARVAATSDLRIPSAGRRYIRYITTFDLTASSKGAQVAAVGLDAATTGYFISQCRNPGTSITEWGLISCNFQENNGSIAISVATGTSCNEATRTTATWTTQTNNTVISVATASYVAYRLLYDLDSGTETPTARDCTINWSEGETRPPVATSVYRDRYYLAYTSSTDSGAANDHLLVLDKNDKWTLFDGHDCYSLTNYERKLYCGASTASGQVWKLDTGTDDDGTAILVRVRTKAFHLGIPEARKKFRRLYLDLEPSPDPNQTITLTGRYTLERSTPTYSLGTIDLNEDPGSIMTSKVPFPLTNPVNGRYLQLELESNGLNSPWRLFSGRLYYSPLEPE